LNPIERQRNDAVQQNPVCGSVAALYVSRRKNRHILPVQLTNSFPTQMFGSALLPVIRGASAPWGRERLYQRGAWDKHRERVMDIQGLIIWLVIGAVAGWLAGQIWKGSGFGLVGNIIVGIIGSLIAGWLLPRIGVYIGGNVVGDVINAVIGAIIALFVIGLVKR
jgi:uncharacterized membrane protein YeaQ/YmgE (transglycosylase-associated protein family)